MGQGHKAEARAERIVRQLNIELRELPQIAQALSHSCCACIASTN